MVFLLTFYYFSSGFSSIAIRKHMIRSERGGPWSAGYTFPVLSGILLGISFPTYPFIRLECIAWIALVPLLLSLRHDPGFREWFLRVYCSMLIFSTIALWWVCHATFLGGLLTIVAQAFFLSVPLVLFYFLKRWRGWRSALFFLPFVWVAWEWAYLSQDLSLGWMVMGNSQALLTPMIQYADVTGVWGVSMWLLFFNSIAADLFVVLRSGRRGSFHFLALIIMLSGSFLYGASVLRDADLKEEHCSVNVTLVQPDIDPFMKWKGFNSWDLIQVSMQMTDRAVSMAKPDLILWPETAIPFHILDKPYEPYFDLLASRVRRWDTAFLSGFSDIVYYSGDEVAGQEHLYKYDARLDRYFQTFNASMFLDASGTLRTIYRKMKLVPFAERVPYVEYFPWLERFSVSLAGISSWGKGSESTIMKLETASGREVKLMNVICYESIFPGLVAGFVRNGAEFLTLVTNDGWYAKSYGPYQHAAIARFRCIENRRGMARCANTGVSLFLDRFGRVTAALPWWQQRTLTASLVCSSEKTLYTRYPDYLPGASVAVSAFLFLFSFVRRRNS